MMDLIITTEDQTQNLKSCQFPRDVDDGVVVNSSRLLWNRKSNVRSSGEK
jgi:hypothetical protein